MAKRLLVEHEYRGVKAFLYSERNSFRILYLRASDGKYIVDMPIKGIKEPWTIKTIEHSIDILFEDAKGRNGKSKDRTLGGVQEIQDGTP